jgi:hypothetical protein
VLVLTPCIELDEKLMLSKQYFKGISSVALPVPSTRYLGTVVVLVQTDPVLNVRYSSGYPSLPMKSRHATISSHHKGDYGRTSNGQTAEESGGAFQYAVHSQLGNACLFPRSPMDYHRAAGARKPVLFEIKPSVGAELDMVMY